MEEFCGGEEEEGREEGVRGRKRMGWERGQGE